MPQDPQLRAIVERMVSAGEPEENIALAIQHYKPQAPAEPSASPVRQAVKDAASAALMGTLRTVGMTPEAMNFAKENPSGAGAITAGTLAAPWTGGMSLLPAMATTGVATGLGSGAGQLLAGQRPDVSTMATEGALGALTAGTGIVAPKVIRGTLQAARQAPLRTIEMASHVIPQLRPVVTVLRLMQRGAPEAANAANAGGRLVKAGATRSAESEMAQALEEVRGAPTSSAQSVTLPPQAELPPGYQPRTTVPKPQFKAAPRPTETPTKTPPAAAPVPTGTRPEASVTPGAAATGPAGEGLSAYEREALDAELKARGLRPRISADDAARYQREYGQMIPPGTSQSRQSLHIQDALDDQRYRFHLDNPASALALMAGGGAAFRKAVLSLLGNQEATREQQY